MFRADLHCHTSCSDGSLTPVQLVQRAKENGLSGLAITDHDSIEAYETAVLAAKDAGIHLGTGVEFSCEFQKMSVHILGYDFSLTSSDIRNFCDLHRKRRTDRNRLILNNLARLRMPIQESELVSLDVPLQTIGRPHIAQVMLKKGYVASIKDAFSLYIGEGKCCYDSGRSFTIEETMDVVHKAGGKIFLAHPHLIDNGKLLKEILKLPFDGIECYYAKCTATQEKRWLKLAKEKGWLISGGSDFHGDFKMHIPLGCSWVDEETFNRIFEKRT